MNIHSPYLIESTYLIATALFILSLKFMSSPATARHGVWAGEVGMLLAIVGALLGMVHMTAVPQRTALSHCFGALCVTLVGASEFYLQSPNVPKFTMSVLAMEVILGSLTFTGSLMAAGKLQEWLPQRPITFKGQNFVNLGLLAGTVAIAIFLVLNPERADLFPIILGVPLMLGVMMIIPIGGADMPTIISLLNSYAGLSAAAMGFVL